MPKSRIVAMQSRSAVILDHHPLVLDAVEQVLARVGVRVVGKTTSPDRALALVEERRPDVLVTEIELRGVKVDGLAFVREAVRLAGVKAIVLSEREDRDAIGAAFEAGAHAYVVKTAHPDDLASAVRQAFNHSVYLADGAAAPASEPEAPGEPQGLTRREVEILQLAAEGRSNAEIAKGLWVTEQTVKFHLSNVYRKLNVSNRTEAGRWAQLNGLLGRAPLVARAGNGAPAAPGLGPASR